MKRIIALSLAAVMALVGGVAATMGSISMDPATPFMAVGDGLNVALEPQVEFWSWVRVIVTTFVAVWCMKDRWGC